MIAKEFRIGNYVEFQLALDQIQGINDLCATLDAGVIDIEWVKPIPLTEEWLIKLGFEEVNYGYKHPELPVTGRWIIYESFLDTKEIEKPFLRFDGLVDIHTVHHLQNWFYAITLKEIEVKSK